MDNKKHFVYYNLHKHLFSCKDIKTGLVDKELYSTNIKMYDCKFKVSKKGRERVIKEQKKNVHAGVVGTVIATSTFDIDDKLANLTELTYNPYLYDSFIVKNSKQKVVSAEIVYLLNKKIYAKNVLTE